LHALVDHGSSLFPRSAGKTIVFVYNQSVHSRDSGGFPGLKHADQI
jgi:hypothetical protein